MAEKYLSESEIKKLLQCTRCKRAPTGPPIYMCKTGHHECAECFVKHTQNGAGVEETDVSTDTESECVLPGFAKYCCTVCKEKVTKTRNLFAEYLLIHLENMKGSPGLEKTAYNTGPKCSAPESNYVDCCYNIYGSSCPRIDAIPSFVPQSCQRFQPQCSIQKFDYTVDPFVPSEPQLDFPDNPNAFYQDYYSSYYNEGHKKHSLTDKRSKVNFGTHGSTMSLNAESSKRPIRCPTHLCGRNIAVAALSHHFCFDHPDVPPVSLDYDVSSHLFIDPEMIPFDYGRCIAILLIPNKCEPLSSMSQPNIISTNRMKNSLPLVVMASRLECNTFIGQNMAEADEEETQSDVLNHGDFKNSESAKSPLLVVWLAGIEANASVYTTIQVTEKQTNVRSVIYTGPIMSLRHSQSTNKIFEQGDCLVIHPGILESIMADRGGVDLHVMVH